MALKREKNLYLCNWIQRTAFLPFTPRYLCSLSYIDYAFKRFWQDRFFHRRKKKKGLQLWFALSNSLQRLRDVSLQRRHHTQVEKTVQSIWTTFFISSLGIPFLLLPPLVLAETKKYTKAVNTNHKQVLFWGSSWSFFSCTLSRMFQLPMWSLLLELYITRKLNKSL